MTSPTQGEHAQPEAQYAEAVKFAKEKASISYVQRKCRCSYNDAERMLERMVSEGIITTYSCRRSAPAVVSTNGAESNMTGGAMPERIAATWLTDPAPSPERQFCEWLNSKHGCNVSEVFHEIMQRFASHAQAPAGETPDVFGLKWPGEDRINLSMVFDTWEEATEYLENRCDTPGILVVRLAAQPTPTAQADSEVQEDAARMDWLEATHQRGHYCGVFSGNLLTRKSIDAARAALAQKEARHG